MFSSESLQKSFESLESHASGLFEKLDAISNDIKTLETRLRELGVAFEVSCKVLAHQKLTTEEESIITPFGYDDELDSFFADEHLVWKKCEKSDMFRLFYRRTMGCEEASLLLGFGEKVNFAECPLIEASAPIRLRLSKFLPAIVDELTSQIHSK